MLKIEQVSFSYGSIRTLREVDMVMQPGEVTCIVGRNGVGKTTLLKNIMGVLKPNSGSITVDDRVVTNMTAYKRARIGLGLVPQGRQIFPRMTVEENLFVGLEASPVPTRNIPEFVYDLFPVLQEMKGRMGGDLSGGQQQQLAIARTLVGSPKVMLLDEPTEGIQPNIIQYIGQVLQQLAQEQNMTIILVEQYLDFVHEFGDRFYLMNRGKSVAGGTTDELTAELTKKYLSV
ncbi:MAG: urea ABC transporter ATP-binding subunit UrtE [Planctomycetota bacterium]|nr:urea ABC transporter ATP-binding subunit UrtE [Planctomycetota bacterium]